MLACTVCLCFDLNQARLLVRRSASQSMQRMKEWGVMLSTPDEKSSIPVLLQS